MSSGSRLLLVGLRGSGKTSYLAALWHLIEAGEVPISLASSQLQPDRQYLNRIRDSWLTFQQVGRTSLRSPETVALLLRDATTLADIHITLPDLSGELFRLQWATRRADVPYARFAADCTGALLLVHPALIRKASRILLSDDSVGAKPPNADSQTTEDSGMVANGETQREWLHDVAPTQVQLVELLQFLSYLRSTTKQPRIAVIVSAWDLIPDPILPSSWVENHLPLLFQFLVANGDTVPFRIYGVSALGGDLQKDLKRLQDEPVPSRRIRVLENELKPHSDLTAPIRFALGLDRD